jgi:sec-independent protein translocase protein TatB
MFNIGSGELVLIAVVALLVLGPKRLPELARGLGKFLREFRRQTDEVRSVVEREFYKMDKDEVAPPLDAPQLPAPAAAPGIVAASAPISEEDDHKNLVPADPEPPPEPVVNQHVDPTPVHPDAAPAVPAATPVVVAPETEPAKKAG